MKPVPKFVFALHTQRLPRTASIRERFQENSWTGVFAVKAFLLTFAFCIKAVGPNAIVVESLSTSGYFVGEVGRNKFVAMHLVACMTIDIFLLDTF